MNLLWQRLALLGGAIAILLIVAFTISVPQYCIELQPDGKSLGCFPGQDIRLVGIAFGSIPLAMSAAMIFASGTRRMKAPVYVGIALAVSLLMLSYLLRTFHN